VDGSANVLRPAASSLISLRDPLHRPRQRALMVCAGRIPPLFEGSGRWGTRRSGAIIWSSSKHSAILANNAGPVATLGIQCNEVIFGTKQNIWIAQVKQRGHEVIDQTSVGCSDGPSKRCVVLVGGYCVIARRRMERHVSMRAITNRPSKGSSLQHFIQPFCFWRGSYWQSCGSEGGGSTERCR